MTTMNILKFGTKIYSKVSIGRDIVAIIKSPVGDMVLKMEGLSVEEKKLVVNGKMGLWESQVVIGEIEAWEVVRMMLKAKVLGYFFLLPFKALFGKLRDEDEKGTELTL